jgi:hypothetical protein
LKKKRRKKENKVTQHIPPSIARELTGLSMRRPPLRSGTAQRRSAKKEGKKKKEKRKKKKRKRKQLSLIIGSKRLMAYLEAEPSEALKFLKF